MTEKMQNVRKSVYELTLYEREAYIQAVLKLKHTPSPISERTYDTYVQWHREAFFHNVIPIEGRFPWFISYAHGCPAFLPWHRQYLRLLELDLQAVADDPSIAIPYWDWAKDEAQISAGKDPEEMPIWDPGFMGGNGLKDDDWRVQWGPFTYKLGRWRLTERMPWDFFSPEPKTGFVRAEPDEDLRRQFGGTWADPEGFGLPTLAKVREVLSTTPFDTAPWSYTSTGFRPSLEGSLHNTAHMWVGWTMSPWTSPNDPSFFIHHSNVDRLWAKWQDLHPSEPYLPQNPLPQMPGQSIDETMKPFGVTPRSVLNYRDMRYEYDGKASDDEPVADEDSAPPDEAVAPTERKRVAGSKGFLEL